MAKKKPKSQDGTSPNASRGKSSVTPEQRKRVGRVLRLIYDPKEMTPEEIAKDVQDRAAKM